MRRPITQQSTQGQQTHLIAIGLLGEEASFGKISDRVRAVTQRALNAPKRRMRISRSNRFDDYLIDQKDLAQLLGACSLHRLIRFTGADN
jgi:hypothetical protein